MNKQDYNSNFKMKISRSLTDLQNSLDEACRLGLPPHFEVAMTNHYDEFSQKHATKGDVRNDLEKLISKKEQSIQHMHFLPPTNSKFLSRSHERGSDISVNRLDNREMFLDVLRSIANDNRPDKVNNQMHRSRSHDELSDLRHVSRENINGKSLVDDLKREIRMLRQRLVCMDEEMMRMRPEESARDEFVGGELCEQLRKKVDTYRRREEALLHQLNEAVATIEEAKYEEMQAMMQAEKSKEDLENMERRFKEYVEESARKIGNESEGIENDVRTSMRHVLAELDEARLQISAKYGESQVLREQVKNADCEIDRLNATVKRLHSDKYNTEHNLEAAVTRATMQRDETASQNNRLEVSLAKERSQRQTERSIMQDEINDLRKRLTVADNNEANATQDRIALAKETEQVKAEMGRMKQMVMNERRREQEEREAKDREWDGKLRRLTMEITNKQIHFESVFHDAEEVMKSQGAMIERLRAELLANVKEMDGWADKNRDEKEELRWRLSRSSEEVVENQCRIRELQETIEEQGRLVAQVRDKNGLLEAMKERENKEMIAVMTARNGLMKTVELMQAHLTELRRRVGDCVCGVFDCGEQLVNGKILEHALVTAAGV